MKILLVSPPHVSLFGLTSPSHIPLGLLYIAATLRDWGIQTSVFIGDNQKQSTGMEQTLSGALLYERYGEYAKALANPSHGVWRSIRETISNVNPDVVGISISTPTHPSAVKVASIAKEVNGDCFVVVGGPHPTVMPQETLKEEVFDAVVRGEGEYAMLDVVEALEERKTLEGIPGVSFRKNSRIIHNQPRAPLEDLDILSFPDRDSIINLDFLPRNLLGLISTSRGCPYTCRYCSCRKIFGDVFRLRSEENVINEIQHVVDKYGVRNISFVDDTFNSSKKRVIKLCRMMRERKLEITWTCLVRENIDSSLLSEMAKSGCREVSMGVESGSQKLLDNLSRGARITKVKEAARMIKDSCISLNVLFMLGVPGETAETLSETEELIKELGAEFTVELFDPFPGTEVWEEFEAEGRILSREWMNYNMLYSRISKKDLDDELLVRKYLELTESKKS